ncbi:hypothetical protein DM02DRAFT_517683 [Periconia macrospinosa]|uniref:Peptidase S33 tripeptidyl aminopeptidase-like C-terminal domain-containing protein n=1 Tax=Periconia macrospinosa TaxID=97972 RepID=A0A2V1E381_9PLEO|nr:hypothetical protein DM02DRAFT_517683 [Periconia macrospinosa]
MAWSFRDIKASRGINWQPCFGSYKCMYLIVPLDYDDTKAGYTNIAYIKYEAKNGNGTEIIYNPGGPGGSGVATLMSVKDSLVKSFGPEYSFVSFDPRGVNNTGPLVLSCGLEENSPSSASIGEQWAQAKANSLYCNNYNAKNSTAKYAGTVANVQDMIYYSKLEQISKGKDPEATKIWYYGVSYGTVIGQTLAAMYPKRVGRMILDGNVNGVEHYTGFVPSSILDTDKTFKFFFEYCYEAGPQLCPLAGNATSAADVQQRYDAVMEKLEIEPYIRANSTDIVTRDEVERQIFRAMYSPKTGFYATAKQVTNLETGNLNEIDEVNEVVSQITKDYDAQGAAFRGNNVLQMITCIDTADNYAVKSLDEFQDGIDQIRSSSEYIYKAFPFNNPLMCNGMKIIPPKSQLFPGFKKTDTNVPILFINNSADPITPLDSAKKMAEYFNNAGVLTVDGPGHGYRSVGSVCADKYARSYLKTGSLPKEGTVCEGDSTPKEVLDFGRRTFSATKVSMRK